MNTGSPARDGAFASSVTFEGRAPWIALALPVLESFPNGLANSATLKIPSLLKRFGMWEKLR